MLKQFKYKSLVWIDLESPTPQELQILGTEYKIHPLVQAELAKPSERSKVDVYKDTIYLVLRFPRVGSGSSRGNNADDAEEIDFVIGKDFIITTHYELINPLNDFGRIFETDFVVKKNHEQLHAWFLFYHMLKEVYANLENRLMVIGRQLKGVEEQVFSGQEREAVKIIADINRELLDCQWTIKSHKEILESLQAAASELFDPKCRYYLQAIAGEERRIWKIIENNLETFDNLRSANESLLSIKTNETMKILTVVAFIFLPLNLIAQLYGATPWSHALMAVFFVAGVILAKRQQWL
jgi:magnesium transporter